MGLFLKVEEADYVLGIWKTDEGIDELLTLLPNSNGYYHNEILSFKSLQRRLEWLSVRTLLFTLFGEEIHITYLSNGKPILSDNLGHISISHTKGYVAVIVSARYEVGIDIEQYATRVQRVTSRFVRDDEQINPYDGNKIWSMLLHWSAKETIFKSISVSDVDFKDHMQIFPFDVAPSGSFVAKEYRTESQHEFRINYLIQPQFVLTWQCNRA